MLLICVMLVLPALHAFAAEEAAESAAQKQAKIDYIDELISFAGRAIREGNAADADKYDTILQTILCLAGLVI